MFISKSKSKHIYNKNNMNAQHENCIAIICFVKSSLIFLIDSLSSKQSFLISLTFNRNNGKH